MVPTYGWRPTLYDEAVVREIFGEPAVLSREFRGWAFALEDWPEFGVMLVPIGHGRVEAVCWSWSYTFSKERFHAKRRAKMAYAAWLNALTKLHLEIAGRR